MQVSRKHCRIVHQDDKTTVQDLGSANGTYLNSERVMEAVVNAGDRLIIGGIAFTVQIDGVPADIEPPSSISSSAAHGAGGSEGGQAGDSEIEDGLAEMNPLSGALSELESLDDSGG